MVKTAFTVACRRSPIGWCFTRSEDGGTRWEGARDAGGGWVGQWGFFEGGWVGVGAGGGSGGELH